MALNNSKISVYAIKIFLCWKYFIKQKHQRFGEEFLEHYSIELKVRGSLKNE